MTPQRRHAYVVRILGLVAGCVALFWLHCTTPLAGGNSSETTNVAVVSDDGSRAVGASVKLVANETWPLKALFGESVVVDSTVTDARGVASFAQLPPVSCNLQIDHNGSGIIIKNFCNKRKLTLSTDTIRLQKFSTLLGSCANEKDTATTVMLAGTAYSCKVDRKKAFSFSAIAPGSFPMLFSSPTGELALAGSAVLTADQTIAKDGLAPDFSSVLIDDFESGYSTSVLGQFTGAGWYTYSDSAMGGASRASRSLQKGAPQGVFCLGAEIILQRPLASPWAGIGVAIGTKRQSWDLSSMTALSFWARGKKTVRISIESPLVDSINKDWPDYGKTIVLDTAWRFYRIPVDSLTLPASKAKDAGITWAMAAKRIYRIEIEGVTSSLPDTFRLQLDDMRLEGITTAEIFSQLVPKEQP